MMRRLIDTNDWERKELYHFFKDFEEPYYGITMELDCARAYQVAKQKGYTFFLYSLYLTLKAVNLTEAFKYRIEGEELFLYDVIDGSSTIDRPDGTFGFSHIRYLPEVDLFMKAASEEVERIRNSDKLLSAPIPENIIHFSVLPWISFTSVSHPRSFSRRDSIPKITLGKFKDQHGRKMIPVSVHVNHAVADGLHVGEFFGHFEKLMKEE
jgi:chloramphenicol O-acetyltransferase type A